MSLAACAGRLRTPESGANSQLLKRTEDKAVRKGLVALCAGLLLAAAAGCSKNYTVAFETQDVINAWGEDRTRELLDVDVVCLSGDASRKHPEFTNGTLKSDAWFRMRDEAGVPDVDASLIYALRSGQSGDKRDRLMGPPLQSRRDWKAGETERSVNVEHPGPGDKEAAILVIGRFKDKNALAKSDAVVVRPLPGWGGDKLIRISVGRSSMMWANRSAK
jgi:hypothetical protein